jgi:uncharacterized protein (TIGR04255 family)
LCYDTRGPRKQAVILKGVQVTGKILSNKPLIEAILEIHWALQSEEAEPKPDSFFSILIGRFYERVEKDFPFYEQLPIANIPIEIIGRVVQHRFRTSEDGWPLMQLGPGIATLNDSTEYNWDDNFLSNIRLLSTTLFDAHPSSKELRIRKLILRYINSVDFDYDTDDVFDFLRDMMKINVSFDNGLFASTDVSPHPDVLDLRFSFPSTTPEGSLNLRFARGMRDERSALIWETVFSTDEPNIDQSADGVIGWADQSHTLIRKWFFKLIEGELLRRFQ